jgi:hypothetical protein
MPERLARLRSIPDDMPASHVPAFAFMGDLFEQIMQFRDTAGALPPDVRQMLENVQSHLVGASVLIQLSGALAVQRAALSVQSGAGLPDSSTGSSGAAAISSIRPDQHPTA